MTAQSRTYLKSKFEQGDTPQGTDYSDLMDSFVSLVDTTAQTLASDLTVPNLVATAVSAGSVNVVGAVNAASVSAQTILGSSATFTGKIEAASVSAQSVAASAFSGVNADITTVSAQTVNTATLNITVATTTKASGGAGGAVPASAAAFAEIKVGGVTYYVALFNVKA